MILSINTQRNATRRLHEEIFNAGVPPRGDQVLPLEEDANDDQAPVNTPSFTIGDIRASFLKISKSIAIQAQAITTQAQAKTTKSNQEVVPRQNQHVGTMASRLIDFIRINPPTLY
ncbi:hypothetical protein EJD97_022147 [Solanum chilense]|uniref:Uncharacterized protein n=1 Tax=Solanum chilense TaxID=4083 RepID=A0A6N2CBU1_SOLCI|nr:hypothetical protein EJD97_022147 [Solanum chilense]